MLNVKKVLMKKQILIIITLFLAQGALAMQENVPTLKALARHAVNTQLYKAAEKGDYEQVAKLLKAGAYVNTKRDYQESPLGAATQAGHEKIVKLLLENHALVDARDADDATPLMYAPSVHIAELLLHAGADVNAVDRNGESVLHYALWHPNIIQSLLHAGANINAITPKGRSVLSYAIERNPSLVQFLLENGASIDTVDSEGSNPLLDAARTGNEELVMLLLTTPNRTMIESAIAGLRAIQKSRRLDRDTLWLLKQGFITQLVEEQMKRINLLTHYRYNNDFTLSEYMRNHDTLGTLLDPNNPQSVARIRQRVEENIRRTILRKPRQQLEPAQGLSQEEVDDIMGSWQPERE
jgi:hypothetical protein